MAKTTAKIVPSLRTDSTSKLPLVPSSKVDPVLASLFTSSAGPIKAPQKTRSYPAIHDVNKADKISQEDSDSPSANGIGATSSDAEANSDGSESSGNEGVQPSLRARKRKRGDLDDNLEQQYMDRLIREEAKETARANTVAKASSKDGTSSDEDIAMVDQGSGDGSEADSDKEIYNPPQHEALAKPEDTADFEKASRTVFLGNVSTDAITSKTAKKTLLRHLQSILPSLPASDDGHNIESFRFRSTAYATKLPKKAAFAKKDLMDATSKSTNAYVVYSTKLAAREAVKQLNGTVILERHLRVDQVAHPAKTDHKRCVFVGNLDFVDDDTQIREDNQHGEEKKRKKRTPGDVEEGLWRQMGKAGKVESVRVVRDPKTRVGKGFAYVQFIDENAVEAALLFNEKNFPPLLPRKIRVMRAKSIKRNDKKNEPPGNSKGTSANARPQDRSMQGRAGKLLGRAGATQLRRDGNKTPKRQRLEDKGEERGEEKREIKPPESFVFEGYRAKSNQGNAGLKLGGSGKRKGKPRNRSAKRGAAWKASGGKK